MKLLKVSLLLLLFGHAAVAQVNLDSLRGIWNDASQTDSVRLRAIHRIAWHGHLRSDPDSALHYSKIQYAFAEQRGRKREMALALNTQGAVYEIKGDFAGAIVRHESSLAIRSELGSVAGITASLTNIGNIHAFKGNHAKALEYYIRSVKVYEQDEDAAGKGMANVLNNIAATYHLQEDLSNALLFYRRSLNIREQLGLKDDISQSLTNIGIVLQGMGELDSALMNFNRGLEIAIATGNRWAEAAALSSIGSVMNAKGDYRNASELFERSMTISEQIGDLVSTAGYLTNASAAHMKLGNTAKALLLSTKAYSIANGTGDAVLLRDAAQNHSEILKANGRFKEALEAFELHVMMRDSIMREENQREAIRLEFMKDAELRESEIALLQSENERKEAETLAERRRRQMTMLGSGGVILLLAGGGAWFVSLRRTAHRQELERQEYRRKVIENDFLRSKLKTHFIKNAMQTIDGFVQDGRSEQAHTYIDRFNTLMRWILETAGNSTVSLEEELEAMRLYLALEEPAAKDGLQWSITVAEDVDAAGVDVPPLILQPFVENAVFHGLRSIGRAGEVRISVGREDGRLVCRVEDNGRGMAPGDELKKESNGLRLVRERLALFSSMACTEASMSIAPTGSGTRAEIRLAA